MDWLMEIANLQDKLVRAWNMTVKVFWNLVSGLLAIAWIAAIAKGVSFTLSNVFGPVVADVTVPQISPREIVVTIVLSILGMFWAVITCKLTFRAANTSIDTCTKMKRNGILVWEWQVIFMQYTCAIGVTIMAGISIFVVFKAMELLRIWLLR